METSFIEKGQLVVECRRFSCTTRTDIFDERGRFCPGMVGDGACRELVDLTWGSNNSGFSCEDIKKVMTPMADVTTCTEVKGDCCNCCKFIKKTRIKLLM